MGIDFPLKTSMIQQFSVRARADARPEDRAAARDSAERPRKERQRRLEDRPEQSDPVDVQLHDSTSSLSLPGSVKKRP